MIILFFDIKDTVNDYRNEKKESSITQYITVSFLSKNIINVDNNNA